MRRRLRVVLVCLLAGLAAAAGGLRYAETMPVGTGERRASPDGRFTAAVTDWFERGFFTGAPHRWFSYEVEGAGVRHAVVGEPVEGPYFGSRSSHRVIRWASDSSAVEFVFPARTLRIRTAESGEPRWLETAGTVLDAPGLTEPAEAPTKP